MDTGHNLAILRGHASDVDAVLFSPSPLASKRYLLSSGKVRDWLDVLHALEVTATHV